MSKKITIEIPERVNTVMEEIIELRRALGAAYLSKQEMARIAMLRGVADLEESRDAYKRMLEAIAEAEKTFEK